MTDGRQHTSPVFSKLALVGIGLIGSSLARVVRERGIVGEIAIASRSQETLDRAQELGLGHTYSTDAGIAVRDADLVIVCVPVGSCGSVTQTIAPYLADGAVLTDVGSVKVDVITQMAPHVPDNVHFIPGHPVAGTEQSGPDAGFASLFDNRWCILTPLDNTDPDAIARLTGFWEATGSNVEIMDATHHDRVLAITSHIPHLISYSITGTAADVETVTNSEVIKFSAGGFRDLTRLAASDPTMWRDVCLHNREAILEMLSRFAEDISALQRLVRWSDGDALFDLFTRTRSIRKSIIDAGQESDLPDFGRLQASDPRSQE